MGTSQTGPRLCARCQHIDFRAIFTIQKGFIHRDEGRFIMYLDQSLHDPSCRACNFFEKVACSEHLGFDASLYHLRVFSVESLFEVKKATTQKPHAVALAVLPGKDWRHFNWRRQYVERGLVLANSLAHSAYPAKENKRILEVAALAILRSELWLLQGLD
jgi:hypothetical protein